MLIETHREGRDAWENAGTDARNPYDPSDWRREAWQEAYDHARMLECADLDD